jgi:hypothetical protein
LLYFVQFRWVFIRGLFRVFVRTSAVVKRSANSAMKRFGRDTRRAAEGIDDG